MVQENKKILKFFFDFAEPLDDARGIWYCTVIRETNLVFWLQSTTDTNIFLTVGDSCNGALLFLGFLILASVAMWHAIVISIFDVWG